jgi:hypothetical protein
MVNAKGVPFFWGENSAAGPGSALPQLFARFFGVKLFSGWLKSLWHLKIATAQKARYEMWMTNFNFFSG